VWWTKLAGSCGAEWWILIPRHCLGPCKHWGEKLAKIGLENGSMTPWLARELAKVGFPVVCMDARAAADAVRSRRVKSDKADAHALAEMLRTGWYRTVYVKSEDSHRLKAMLGARDQLVRAKRALGNQVRGVLRPFGIRLPSRQGTKKFAEAAHQAVRRNNMLHASVTALLEALAAIEDINRFRRMRSVGAYLGLTTRGYQSNETDVVLGISRQGDAMARHYLYEAANVLLTTVRRPSALKSWGLKLMKRRGPKRARVGVARRLAILLGRIWKDRTHFDAVPA
jgi:transposase